MTHPRPLLTLVVVLLAALCAPAAAHAGPDQASIMMDDDQLLYRSNVTQTRTLVTMRSLGADAVRATVLWRVAAEGAQLTDREIERLKTDAERKRARAQRARFKPSDPRTYPTRNWDRYDNLVKEATHLGMRVFFTITGPGPSYAHRKAPPNQRANAGTFKPIPTRFRSFVEAVGKRYSGTYRDENAVRRPLPRVTLWSLWNEPNQPGWLSPQWEQRDGQIVPASPALYRALFHAGREGLRRSGHGDDAILLGETAPLGSDKTGARNGIKPVPFLRELVCIRPDGTQYTGADAARRDCQTFDRTGPLRATAFAHHPYTKRGAPTKAPKTPEDITIANIATLGPILDALSTASGGKIAADMQVFLTEFGYESNPPDPRNGLPYMRQAEFNQLAEFLAFNDPRVRATTQFLLRDVGPAKQHPRGSRLYWLTYQSGLYTITGRAKPAAFGYSLPFVIFPAGEGVIGFWGQLRFRPNGAQDVAIIQWRPDTKTAFQQVSDVIPTSFRGFFGGALARPGPGGEYRAAYLIPGTETEPPKIGAYSLASPAPR